MTNQTNQGADYSYILYETLDNPAIARITLNRPEVRNAQHFSLLQELDQAFSRAEADDAVRVIILAGAGPLFSAGHDLGTPERDAERAALASKTVKRGLELRMLQEWQYFLTYTRRWRDLRKITIAQVHGSVIAAGLMLAWCCDLIVAAEGTIFVDVVGTRLGMCGLEYFAHPWEFGARKAKELLLTGDSIDAEEAHRLGMVSKIFPADRLAAETEALAARIAQLPSVTSLLIKESVNQTQDAQGFYTALQSCFSLHQMNHAHWAEVTKGEAAIATPEFGGNRAAPIRPSNPYSSGVPVGR